MKYVALSVGFLVGNLLYTAFIADTPNYGKALEVTYWQTTALMFVWVMELAS